MTQTEASPVEARIDRSACRGPWVDRIDVHLALYALLLGLLLVLTPTLDPWTSDDGAYAQATRLVAGGTWSEELPALDLRDDPTRYGLALSEVGADGRAYPYIKHPAWITVQRATVAVAGERVGFVLPNLLGCMLAAGMAWAVSRRLEVGRPVVAFWLVALSPLGVLSTSLWSHGLAAGAGGVAALMVTRLLERRSALDAGALGLALGAIVALRTEGAIVVPAAVVALAVVRLGRSRDFARLIDPAVAGLVAVGIAIAERAWIATAVTSGPLSSTGPDAGPPSTFIAGRTLAAWRTFALGANGDTSGELLTLAMMWCSIAAVVVVAKGGDRRLVGFLASVAVVAGAIRYAGHVHGQDSLISGILPTWPVMAAGVALWVRARAGAGRAERGLAVLAGLFLAGVLAVQYDGGAGTDWGGRYLTPIAVPLAVLAAAGLARAAGETAGSAHRSRVLAVTVVVGLILTAFGTHVTLTMRSDAARVVERARASEADVVISLQHFVPRTDLAKDATTFWRRSGEDDPAAAVERAFAEGHLRVGVLGADADDVEVPGAEREVLVEDELVVFTR